MRGPAGRTACTSRRSAGRCPRGRAARTTSGRAAARSDDGRARSRRNMRPRRTRTRPQRARALPASAVYTSGIPSPSAAKNANSWNTPRSFGFTRGGTTSMTESSALPRWTPAARGTPRSGRCRRAGGPLENVERSCGVALRLEKVGEPPACVERKAVAVLDQVVEALLEQPTAAHAVAGGEKDVGQRDAARPRSAGCIASRSSSALEAARAASACRSRPTSARASSMRTVENLASSRFPSSSPNSSRPRASKTRASSNSRIRSRRTRPGGRPSRRRRRSRSARGSRARAAHSVPRAPARRASNAAATATRRCGRP